MINRTVLIESRRNKEVIFNYSYCILCCIIMFMIKINQIKNPALTMIDLFNVVVIQYMVDRTNTESPGILLLLVYIEQTQSNETSLRFQGRQDIFISNPITFQLSISSPSMHVDTNVSCNTLYSTAVQMVIKPIVRNMVKIALT